VRATSTLSETVMTLGVEAPAPAAIEFVTISRQEHIALKSAANYWQTAHRKAVDRFKWRELRTPSEEVFVVLRVALAWRHKADGAVPVFVVVPVH